MVRISDKGILNFDNCRKEEFQCIGRQDRLDGITENSSIKSKYQIFILLVFFKNYLLNKNKCLGRSQPIAKKTVKEGVDIMQMDTEKDPSMTESTLEFILNTLCRALNMKPKQAAALLTNNNQFLIHCIVKGVKGRFEPMINWYQEIYQYSRHLSMMLEIEIDNASASGD